MGSLICYYVAIEIRPQGVLAPLARLRQFSNDDHIGTLTSMEKNSSRNC